MTDELFDDLAAVCHAHGCTCVYTGRELTEWGDDDEVNPAIIIPHTRECPLVASLVAV